MSERDDFTILNQLEAGVDWDLSDVVENSESFLLSLDADCRRLVDTFDQHCDAFDLRTLPAREQCEALAQIATLLEREFENLRDLMIDSVIQTRGEKLCLTFNERGVPDDIQLLTDDTRVRGELLGVHCLPVPTEYALLMNISEDENEYKPTLCLMLQAVNLNEFEDIVTTDNIVAIPLRSDNVGFDQVVERVV
jgi:hypothetical protein